jgi:hypothetical protein
MLSPKLAQITYHSFTMTSRTITKLHVSRLVKKRKFH